MRKLYWYLTAYAKKHGLVFTSSIFIAIALFSLLLPTVLTSLEKSQRRYIGIVGEYTLNSLPRQVSQQLSAGLTAVAADGSVVPLLAERWTVENDGKTYRFVLKQNLFWNDGKKFTVADLNYSFKDVTVKRNGDYVISFILEKPLPIFPTYLTTPVIKSELVGVAG